MTVMVGKKNKQNGFEMSKNSQKFPHFIIV